MERGVLRMRSICHGCHALEVNAWNKKRYAVRRKADPVAHYARFMLYSATKRAKAHGWKCDLTREWLTARLRLGRCEATGAVLDFAYRPGGLAPFTPSIDRKQADLGYTKENCQIVALIYNRVKGQLEDGQFKKLFFDLMTDQPKTRAERREEDRVNRKDYDAVVKDIKATLEERPDDEFKLAVMQALQHMDLQQHDNNLISALMIGGCVDCATRGDDNAARLLLYISGTVLDPILTRFTLNTIMQARQAYVMPQSLQKPPGSD